MYKLTIKNAGQYTGFELQYRELIEAANFVADITSLLPGNAELEFHIEPVKEGADQ